MPLTIAHPAAVLPIRKFGLPLSALLIGSITPDLEYYLHLTPIGRHDNSFSELLYGHGIPGVFLFCLPVGLVMLLVMHNLWKPAVASLLSRDSNVAMEFRSKRFSFWPISRLGVVCLGIVIGAFSHLLWDSFTHSYGLMVQHLPLLRTTIQLGNGISQSLYRLLQHISTIFGITVLTSLVVINRGRIGRLSFQAWAIVLLVGSTCALVGLGFALKQVGVPVDLLSFQHLMVYSIASSFALAVAGVTLLSLAWRVATGPDQ